MRENPESERKMKDTRRQTDDNGLRLIPDGTGEARQETSERHRQATEGKPER